MNESSQKSFLNRIRNANYLHIGLPRAGSTFLPQRVFPCIEHVSIYSDENLYGPVFRNRYSSYFRDGMIDFFRKNFRGDGIIIVLRERKSWIKSCYRYYIESGGYLSFQSWCEIGATPL